MTCVVQILRLCDNVRRRMKDSWRLECVKRRPHTRFFFITLMTSIVTLIYRRNYGGFQRYRVRFRTLERDSHDKNKQALVYWDDGLEAWILTRCTHRTMPTSFDGRSFPLGFKGQNFGGGRVRCMQGPLDRDRIETQETEHSALWPKRIFEK